MNWHAATVSKRGNMYYAVMTIPTEARGAMGGKTQLRLSCGTSDQKIAKRRRFELEGQMRLQVTRAMGRDRLRQPDSAYQRAAQVLSVQDKSYFAFYDPRYDVIELQVETDPPTTSEQADSVLRLMETRLLKLRDAELDQSDARKYFELCEVFGGIPPSYGLAESAFEGARLELGHTFGTLEQEPTVGSFLVTYKRRLEERAERGTMKIKTAKETARFLDRFIEVVGDLPLKEVQPRHAHKFAEFLGETLATSSVKTRVRAVGTMLQEAHADGLIDHQPFQRLKLRNYGRR